MRIRSHVPIRVRSQPFSTSAQHARAKPKHCRHILTILQPSNTRPTTTTVRRQRSTQHNNKKCTQHRKCVSVFVGCVGVFFPPFLCVFLWLSGGDNVGPSDTRAQPSHIQTQTHIRHARKSRTTQRYFNAMRTSCVRACAMLDDALHAPMQRPFFGFRATEWMYARVHSWLCINIHCCAGIPPACAGIAPITNITATATTTTSIGITYVQQNSRQPTFVSIDVLVNARTCATRFSFSLFA